MVWAELALIMTGFHTFVGGVVERGGGKRREDRRRKEEGVRGGSKRRTEKEAALAIMSGNASIHTSLKQNHHT